MRMAATSSATTVTTGGGGSGGGCGAAAAAVQNGTVAVVVEEPTDDNPRPRVPRVVEEYYTEDVQRKHPPNKVDHRPNGGGPLLELLWCEQPDNNDEEKGGSNNNKKGKKEALHGQTLYLGGEIGSDGLIYCIPGHADRILTIDPATDKVRQFGPSLQSNGTKFRWLRGIPCHGGDVIYGLPCHADAVLRIDVKSGKVTQLPIPYESFYSQQSENIRDDEDAVKIAKQQRRMIWKYHGGCVSPVDGCIYAVPQSSWHVLKIDPTTDECTLVGPRLEGKYKWYGGVASSLESGGAIYAVPQNASSVLRITPTSITEHGSWPAGGHKWHGAAMSGNGVVVCVSNNVDTVLCIVPGNPEPTMVEIGSDEIIKTGRHRSDKKYKYLGAMAGPNGRVYIFPSGSEQVLEVDTSDIKNMTCRNVGPNLRDAGMERIFQNKWQNGLTNPFDDCVYAIPLAGETLLRIDCSKSNTSRPVAIDDEEDVVVTTWLLPSPYEQLDKWEGAVQCPNGLIYTVPNNCKAVLKIQPCGWTNDDAVVGGKNTSTTEVSPSKEQDHDTVVECSGDDTTTKKNTTTTKALKTTKKIVAAAALLGSVSSQQSVQALGAVSPPAKPNKSKNDKNRRERGDISHLKYKSGIPTLRSSAHRVKFDVKRRKHDPRPRDADGNETHTTWLPDPLLQEDVFPYDMTTYDLKRPLIDMLQDCDPEIVGSFRPLSVSSDENGEPSDQKVAPQQDQTELRLEDFEVPVNSVWRSVNGGCCEDAQRYLSDRVASNQPFLESFDRFVTGTVLPYVKQRLVDCGAISNPSLPTAFYYQRPPTLRLQPGPSWATVKPHNDAEYGHQNGELNIWVPLTDRSLTGVDLWSESEYKKDDYHPIAANVGEAISFHGSSRRHYVNPNASSNTRVSLDFRIGVQGYFDPVWSMQGTTDDHTRRKVEI